jgi:hypothetical protein
MKTRCRSSIVRPPVVSRLAVGLSVSVLVSAVALAGCSPAPTGADVPAAPTPTRPAAAAPAPSGPTAPDQVLDGDCSALFPDAVVSELLGTTVAARELFLDSPITHAVPTLGGLDCEWTAPAGADGAVTAASLRAVVLSSQVLSGTAQDSVILAAGTEDVSCVTGVITASSVDAGACSFTARAGELWLSGVVYSPAGTPEDGIRSAVATLSDEFRALPTGDAVAPAVPKTPAGGTAWVPPACGDLSAAAGVTETLHSPDLVGNDVDTTGGSDSAAGIQAAQAGAEVFACAWYHSGPAPAGQLDGFSIQGLPGGAWAQDRVLALPGARVVDVPGADLAVRVPTAVGHDTLDVFDGVNWLQISRADGLEPVLPVLPALLDALNSSTEG